SASFGYSSNNTNITSRSPADLVTRANEIQDILDPIAKKNRTTAVLQTDKGDIVGGGTRDLTPSQRSALTQGETAAKLPDAHAEITVLNEAANSGSTPQVLGVSREICPACKAFIEAMNGELIDPQTAIFEPGE